MKPGHTAPPGRSACVIAMTAEDDRYEHVRQAGVRVAQAEGLPLILYDIDAASLLNEPMPSGWSAEGAGDQFGDRLTSDDLRRLGRAAIARQVDEARQEGVDAYGWLPTSHGPDPLAEYAAEQRARVIVMPAEREQVDPLTALLVGTRRPINHLAEEAPARVVVAHPDGSVDERR
jgi:hypothetical protein